MTDPSPSDPVSDGEPPGVPGFSTWRSVYLFTLGWFALLVVLLAAFSWTFA